MEAFYEWILDALGWLIGAVDDIGYGGVAVLMAIESSFVPFPSEIVMPPAGFAAATGRLNFGLVCLAGIAGSLAGATLNYVLAAWLGRAGILKLGRRFGLTESRLAGLEAWFTRHGEISTFLARLIPVVRQVISIPAGLARMHFGRFLLFTGLGAGIWVVILTWIGYALGNSLGGHLDSERAFEEARDALFIVLPALVLVGVAYIWWHRRMTQRLAVLASAAVDPPTDSRA